MREKAELRSRPARLPAALAALACAACGQVGVAVVDPVSESGFFVEVLPERPIQLDLLFVVDGSGSMAEEQASLAATVEAAVRELVAPEPNPETGLVRPSIDDLHVGVVSSDLGSAGVEVPGCSSSVPVEAGVLRTGGEGCTSAWSGAGCEGGACPWLASECGLTDRGADPPGPAIWEELACAASLGTAGCRFEQPLEASLVALTEQTRPGRPNEGFVRASSLLAVVYVTDEDDCSAASPELFRLAGAETEESLGLGCVEHEDLLHPVERYRDALLGLRPGAPDRVLVAVVAGVPLDRSWQPGDSIDALRALRRPDPADPSRLAPGCSSETALASPPPRLAELAHLFRENGLLLSICSDWTPVTAALTRGLRARFGPCWRYLPSDPAASCRVEELLTDDRPCPGGAAGFHRDLGLDERGRRRCEVLPADHDADGCPDGPCDCELVALCESSPCCPGRDALADCLQGWYSPRSAECPNGEVRFTPLAMPSPESRTVLVCRTSFCPERRRCPGAADDARPCDPAEGGWCPSGLACTEVAGRDACEGSSTCNRCVPTAGSLCTGALTEPEAPVIDGDCCREGFHCDPAARACVPDRETDCE